jgi:hypothetical protein
MRTAIHVTHEAATKIGGIGAVLNGVCTANAYKKFFDRTVFYGPLFDFGGNVSARLGPEGEVLFSTPDFYASGQYDDRGGILAGIASKYNVDIVYGRRRLVSEYDRSKQNAVDIFLIGIHKTHLAEVGKFKYILWKRFGIQSELYEGNWDYEQYLRIAIPYLDILARFYGEEDEFYHFSHEYMGVACALSVVAAAAEKPPATPHKTIFVAHEVATARMIVEGAPGHDVSFYNLMAQAGGKKSLEEVFGDYRHNARNELVKCAINFDRVFAVSDIVKDEYLFLQPKTPPGKVRTVFNGVSTRPVTREEKMERRRRVEAYINTLFGFTPSVIFTHVTRMVISKGIWRDITLLHLLDELFSARHLKGAYILLSTLIGTGRPPQDILRMEREYGWPVTHRRGWPDLVGMEEEICAWLQIFNSKSKAIKALYINQFGFDRVRCGARVPEGSEFMDLRVASDAELGFSIYEPFGIAQIETVPFGGAALLSSTCGSAKFLERAFDGADSRLYDVVDFVSGGKSLTVEQLQVLPRERRDEFERAALAQHAARIFERLSMDDAKREEALALAQPRLYALSWENVVENYYLPNLTR